MKKYILAALLFVCAGLDQAHAANCAPYTYTLTNGQTADANQVMSNFNTVRDCGNNNLMGRSNNLSDVTSVTTARSNLGLGAAAVENLGNTTNGAVIDDGAGNLVVSQFPGLHSQTFGTNGTFTVPAGTSSSTVFKFMVIGGGGSGGGTANSGAASGGGSGGAIVVEASGFTAGGAVTINIGSGGTAATGAGGNSGNATTVVYNAATIITANGGTAGVSNGVCHPRPLQGTVSDGSGGGAVVLAAWQMGAQPGECGTGGIGGNGGGNPIGAGGIGGGTSSSGPAGGAGGAGGGGDDGSLTTTASGAGGGGVVIVEWVL